MHLSHANERARLQAKWALLKKFFKKHFALDLSHLKAVSSPSLQRSKGFCSKTKKPLKFSEYLQLSEKNWSLSSKTALAAERVHEKYLRGMLSLHEYSEELALALCGEQNPPSDVLTGRCKKNELTGQCSELVKHFTQLTFRVLESRAKKCQVSKEALGEALEVLEISKIESIVEAFKAAELKRFEFVGTPQISKALEQLIESKVSLLRHLISQKLDQLKPENPFDRSKSRKKLPILRVKSASKATKKPLKKRAKAKFPEIMTQTEELVQVDCLTQSGQSPSGTEILFKESLTVALVGHVKTGKSTIWRSVFEELAQAFPDLDSPKNQRTCSRKRTRSRIKQRTRTRTRTRKQERSRTPKKVWRVHSASKPKGKKALESGKSKQVEYFTIETRKKRLTLIDCPGNRAYLPEIIPALGQADVAALVVSVKPGEFESGFLKKGQTKEYLVFIKCLGVQTLVIVFSKADTVDWSRERLDYIKRILQKFLVKGCGFKRESVFWSVLGRPAGPLSSGSKNCAARPWPSARAFIETLDTLSIARPKVNCFLRIPVFSKFKHHKNTVVGKVQAGNIKPQMRCVALPSMKPLTVSKILDQNQRALPFARPGDNVQLEIEGLGLDDFKRGFVICGKQYWVNTSSKFRVLMQVHKLAPHQIVTKGFIAVMHLHTAVEEVTVSKIVACTSRRVSKPEHAPKRDQMYLTSGDKATVVLKTKKPVCLEKFLEFPALGRLLLRKNNTTIASAHILNFVPSDRRVLKNNSYFLQKQKS